MKKYIKLKCTLSLVILALFYCIASGRSSIDTLLLSLKVDSIMKEFSIPGVALGIVRLGEPDIIICRGFAEKEGYVPVTPETAFRVSSITKTFIGIAFLEMERRGLIDLDQPVMSLVPDVSIDNPWEDTDPILVRHLLEHTAGFDDLHFSNYDTGDPEAPLAEGLKRTEKARRVRWIPGTVYSYSGVGYLLAGYIMESVTGLSFEDYTESGILKSLGMNNSFLRLDPERQARLARGYGYSGGPIPYPYVYARPAASLHSTVEDMLSFLHHLARGFEEEGDSVLSPGLMKNLLNPDSSHAGRLNFPIRYGTGIGSYLSDGFIWYGHNGSDPGYASVYMYSPRLKAGYVIMTNMFDRSGTTGIRLLKAAVESAIIQSVNVPPVTGTPSAVAEKYVGVYRRVDSRQRLFSWMEYLFGCRKISTDSEGSSLASIPGGSGERLLLTQGNHYLAGDDGNRLLMFGTNSESGNEMFLLNHGQYEKTSAGALYASLTLAFLVAAAVTFILVLYPVITVITLVRLVLKKSQVTFYRFLHFPFWGLVALIAGTIAYLGLDMTEMGQKNMEAIIFQWGSIIFMIFSLAGVIHLVTNRKRIRVRGVRAGLAAMTGLQFSLAAFLLFEGIIGLRFWAF
ncbi:MAG: beta-lactamase family protein [Bacteroidales bacterium]|nr:beta-lactamase family protein [Bacteroidales bacterium]